MSGQPGETGSLLRSIEAAVQLIEESPSNAGYLRHLKESIEDWLVSRADGPWMAEVFSMFLYLEHILFMLTGDVTYYDTEGSARTCDEIFEALTPALRQLESLLDGNLSDPSRFWAAYKEAIGSYLLRLARLNRELAVEPKKLKSDVRTETS